MSVDLSKAVGHKAADTPVSVVLCECCYPDRDTGDVGLLEQERPSYLRYWRRSEK
jgi:hypothetical protein